MPSLPNGPMVAAVEKIRQAIDDCHHWTGGVYIDALPAPAAATYTAGELAALRPFALISQGRSEGFVVDARNVGGDCHVANGHVSVQIELPIPDSVTNDNDLGLHVLTVVGRMIWTGDAAAPGLLDLSSQPGRPFIRRVVMGDYGRCLAEDVIEYGDHVGCDLDLYWGVRG